MREVARVVSRLAHTPGWCARGCPGGSSLGVSGTWEFTRCGSFAETCPSARSAHIGRLTEVPLETPQPNEPSAAVMVASTTERKEEEREACNAETLKGETYFEDTPMPLIECQLSEEIPTTKALLDSGASINLVTEKMAAELERPSAPQISTSIRAPVRIWTNSVKFHIMPQLPFEILLGNQALYEWNAKMEWRTRTLTIQNPRGGSIDIEWTEHKGQHWRRPISLLARDEVTIPPQSQT